MNQRVRRVNSEERAVERQDAARCISVPIAFEFCDHVLHMFDLCILFVDFDVHLQIELTAINR